MTRITGEIVAAKNVTNQPFTEKSSTQYGQDIRTHNLPVAGGAVMDDLRASQLVDQSSWSAK